MLLANMSVAKIVADAFPDQALLRRHPPPDEKKLSAVLDVAKSLVRHLLMCHLLQPRLNMESSSVFWLHSHLHFLSVLLPVTMILLLSCSAQEISLAAWQRLAGILFGEHNLCNLVVRQALLHQG